MQTESDCSTKCSRNCVKYYPETYDEYLSWIFNSTFHEIDPETSIRNFTIAEEMENEEEEYDEESISI